MRIATAAASNWEGEGRGDGFEGRLEKEKKKVIIPRGGDGCVGKYLNRVFGRRGLGPGEGSRARADARYFRRPFRASPSGFASIYEFGILSRGASAF